MSIGADMAERITDEAWHQGRSLASVLRQAGANSTAVTMMKRSKYGPTAMNVIRICNVLGKDPNWLFGWEVPKEET